MVAEAAHELCQEHRVPGLPGGGDAEPVGALRVVSASGVRGDPPGDLPQFPDLHQQAAPRVFGVFGLPVEPDGCAQFPEGGGDQVAAGQHVVREPETVHPRRQAVHGLRTDPATATRLRRLPHLLGGQ
ncbi:MULTISPECIES: hypothetical protein [Streptomyces]|uniref:hypothetical protein n=1 Tax=Streptomyces TaxID=1883 RepID=UPI00199D3C85|nr:MULTISPECIES: hypothetical protein [Streptomyces]GGR74287.1 hypothetical protein GCM10010236_31020 [Streptomyces eurythermus]